MSTCVALKPYDPGPSQERMPLESAFRSAMRSLAAQVHVITTISEGTWHGMTATAVCSLSMEPPSLLISVNAGATLHGPLQTSQRFCVNILPEAMLEIAMQFGSSASRELRFKKGNWDILGGCPALQGASANVVCKVEQMVPFGSHTVFLAIVEEVRVFQERRSLVFHEGSYRCVAELENHAHDR